MTVGTQVPRHAIHERGEIGAVVELHAAQEVLVGLVAARVLRGEEAGHHLEQFSHPKQRAHGEIGAARLALAGRRNWPGQDRQRGRQPVRVQA